MRSRLVSNMNKLEARRKNLENILQRLHTSNVNTSQTNAGMDNIAFGARKYSDIFIKEVLENLRYQTLAVTSKKYNIPFFRNTTIENSIYFI